MSDFPRAMRVGEQSFKDFRDERGTRKFIVTVDGREMEKVIAYDMDAGMVECYKVDPGGKIEQHPRCGMPVVIQFWGVVEAAWTEGRGPMFND